MSTWRYRMLALVFVLAPSIIAISIYTGGSRRTDVQTQASPQAARGDAMGELPAMDIFGDASDFEEFSPIFVKSATPMPGNVGACSDLSDDERKRLYEMQAGRAALSAWRELYGDDVSVEYDRRLAVSFAPYAGGLVTDDCTVILLVNDGNNDFVVIVNIPPDDLGND